MTLCVGGLQLGCSGNKSSSGSAPSGLEYPQSSIVATVGTAIVTDTPTVTGTVTSYAVTPTLPAGLNLSASTGAISGTPTAPSAQNSYSVQASNTVGSTTATVHITVNPAVTAPANLGYSTATIAAIEGLAITTDTPTVTGTVTSWSVTPQLPTGLSQNSATGAIGGIPSQVVSPSNYTVTAANAGGSTTAVIQIGVAAASVNQAVHATFVSGHQSFHAALNYTYTPLNFALPSTSPIKSALARALQSHIHAMQPAGQSEPASSQPTVSYNDDLGLYQTEMIQNGNTAAINYYTDAAATMPAGATTLTFPDGVTAGNYSSSSYPLTLPITQNITAGKIPCTGAGTIVLLDAQGKNTIQGSLNLTRIGLTVTADIALDDEMNVTGSGTISENGETITVSGMAGPFAGNIAGSAVLTPQNYTGMANISITAATFSAVFTTPNGVATCSSANDTLSIQYPDGSIEILTDPNDTQPNAPPSTSTGGPIQLSYALATISATVGQVLINDTPTVTGTVAAWTITPALPAGLGLDPTSGIISGTPTAVSGTTAYVITASNASGFTQGTVQITVSALSAPSGLSYSSSTVAATVGVAIANDTPTVTGSVTTWSISPSLPAGLGLDTSSGIISGTPTAASAQTSYTITAANAAGSTTAIVQITVSPASNGPGSVTYAATNIVINMDQAITADIATLNGSVGGLTITPNLPYGMSFDPNTGLISGAPATQMPPTTFYISGQQTAGVAATVQITVNEGPIHGIVAQDAVFTGSTLNLASFPSTSAQSDQWSLVNQTSGGTITSGMALDLIQYTVGTTPGTYQLSVTAQPASGNAATFSRTLNVVHQQFLKDPASSFDRGTPTSSVLANGTILFVGNADVSIATSTNSTELFDPISATFSAAATMKVPRGSGQAQVSLANGKVLVCGGLSELANQYGVFFASTALSESEIYDPAANTWANAASMNSARSGHTLTLLQNGNVLAAGGVDAGGNALNTAEIYDPAANSWTAVANLTTARSEHTATLLNDGTVLVTGGYDNSAEVYNVTANTWTAAGTMQAYGTGYTTTLLSNGKVLVTGGEDSQVDLLQSAQIYDPATKTWSNAAPMSVTRIFHTASLLSNGKVLIAGGQGVGGGYGLYASAAIYDPVANTWTDVASLNVPRFRQLAFPLANGNVLVAYGSTLSTSGFDAGPGEVSAESYSPTANTWTATGMSPQLTGFSAATLANGQALLSGGISTSPSGSAAANSAQIFNPATDAWSIGASLLTARENHTSTLLANGKMLVVGGDTATGLGNNPVLASVELYDPSANTWTAAASLITGRTNHTATLLANGKVLVAGGVDSSGNPVPTAEVYDPQANTWTPAGSLIHPRYGHTATLLNTGKVLVVGGVNGISSGGTLVPLSTTELYDPSANTWTAAAVMQTGVYQHTATLLSDGTLMIAGGANAGYTITDGVMLYTPGSNTWSQLAPMNNPRAQHTATLLPSGQVLVAGGEGGILTSGTDVAASEIFTPSANTWTSGAPLKLPRNGHLSILLNDGRVMIVGGFDGFFIPEFWKQ